MDDRTRNSDEISLEIRCPVEMRVLPIIRCFIVSVARQMGFKQDDVDKIEICVDEACANAIEHGYRDAKQPRPGEMGVRILMRQYADRLKITISDFGAGAKAGPYQGAGSVEEYIARQTPRGLGSYIMRLFMDEFSIEYPEESGTEVTLVKMLPAEDSKPWPG